MVFYYTLLYFDIREMFICNTFRTYSNRTVAFFNQALRLKFKCRQNNQYINLMESI